MLTKLEIAALKGIQARDREIQEKHIKPIQEDLNEILQAIQSRLKDQDPSFEFGKTHKLDLNNLVLVPTPAEPALESETQGANVIS